VSQSRQLAAVMFTDIVGYTALMGKDEQKAFELLNKNRQIQKPIIEQFNGRWIKELGDGILASFTTDSDAVNAAIKIQEACNKTKEFFLRIGIHQGEVVFEGDDIFGDAVNIASRIQAIAEPGGIFISESVHDNVSNKQGIETMFVKQETLKNVKEPVRIYKVIAKEIKVPYAVTSATIDIDKGELIIRQNKRKKTLFFWSVGILIMLAFGYFIYNNFHKAEKSNSHLTDPDVIDKSIAVLPFVNMSNDKNQEYFSDGLSEELLNLLAKTPELKVIGRTSSFSFKGKNEDLRSIAQKLGVAHILEGSVRKEGNNIRVNAQLIKATDGSNLWSETYDRELEGIFKLQHDIAGQVVRQLKLKLLAVPANSPSSLTNTEAYNLLLQGNFFLDKRDRESVAKAFEFYRQALVIDSSSARAWASMAKCLNIQASWGWIDRTGHEEAKKAATKALALDDKQVEAHRSLGEAKMYDFDWEKAEAEFQKALNLEPGNPDVLRIMAILAIALGQIDKAISLCKQSLIFDPIRPITYHHLGIDLYYANHSEEAILNLRKALELNPQFPRAHTFLGDIYLLQGKSEMALAEIMQETDKTWTGYGLSLAYHALGRKKEADQELRNYIAEFQKGNTFEIAEIYAFRDEKNKAFEWLEKAYHARAARLVWFKNNPLLKNLESDPRHLAFLKMMNLPLD